MTLGLQHRGTGEVLDSRTVIRAVEAQITATGTESIMTIRLGCDDAGAAHEREHFAARH